MFLLYLFFIIILAMSGFIFAIDKPAMILLFKTRVQSWAVVRLVNIFQLSSIWRMKVYMTWSQTKCCLIVYRQRIYKIFPPFWVNSNEWRSSILTRIEKTCCSIWTEWSEDKGWKVGWSIECKFFWGKRLASRCWYFMEVYLQIIFLSNILRHSVWFFCCWDSSWKVKKSTL